MFRKNVAGECCPMLNADGSRFAVVSAIEPLELWDVADGQKLRDFPRSFPSGCCIWFNQDGTKLYGAGPDNSVDVWDVETGKKIFDLVSGGAIRHAHSDANDTRVVTFSVGGTAQVLSLQPLGEVATWDFGQTGFNPGGSLDVAGSQGAALFVDQGTVEVSAVVFDRSTGHVERVLKDVEGQRLRLSPDGARLAVQDAPYPYGAILIHNLATAGTTAMKGLCLWDENLDDAPDCNDPPSTPFVLGVWDLAFSSDGSLLAGGGTGNVAVWNSTNGDLLWSRKLSDLDHYVTVALSPGSKVLATSLDRDIGTVVVFDARTGREVKTITGADFCGNLRFSRDGRALFCGTENGTVFIIDAASWKIARQFKAHEGRVTEVDPSPDGKIIATSGADGFVRTWDLESGAALQAFFLGEGRVQSVRFLDDRHLAARSETGPFLVYTLDTDELLQIARHRLTRGFTLTECQTYHLDPCPDLAAIQAAGSTT